MKDSERVQVGLVADSTADIPTSVAEELGIAVVPCHVHFEQEAYQDGVDISREQFYARLSSDRVVPTTAQLPVGMFVEVYERLREQMLWLSWVCWPRGKLERSRRLTVHEP